MERDAQSHEFNKAPGQDPILQAAGECDEGPSQVRTVTNDRCHGKF
jgi:hypothetical protein